eukprot:2310625-Prymnesium_polylepis.2
MIAHLGCAASRASGDALRLYDAAEKMVSVAVVRLIDNNNSAVVNPVYFTMKPTTTLGKLMNVYCDRQGDTRGSVCFQYGGAAIKEDDTPAAMGMQAVSSNFVRVQGSVASHSDVLLVVRSFPNGLGKREEDVVSHPMVRHTRCAQRVTAFDAHSTAWTAQRFGACRARCTSP